MENQKKVSLSYTFAKGILNLLLKKGVITIKQYDELDKRNKEKYE